MPWLDVLFLVVLLASVVLGLLRGFVRELFSLASWMLAGVLAWQFGPALAPWFGRWLADDTLQLLAGSLAIFIAGVIALGIVGALASSLLGKTGLRAVDRSLGGVFGLARAGVLAAGLVLLIDMTGFADAGWARRSHLLPWLQGPAHMLEAAVRRGIEPAPVPGGEV